MKKGTKQMRMVTIHGSKVLEGNEGLAVRLAASRSLADNRLARREERIHHRNAPDRHSVLRAMLAVEERLVKSFWTIARQPIAENSAPKQANRCGVDYFHDQRDSLARYADAAGGKWDSVAPRPSLPSSKEIDDANNALDWLLLIDDEKLRRLLVVGATSKRGDAGRRIGWERLRSMLPEYGGFTVRTLQRKYQDALRTIVSELTLAKVA